MTKFDFQRTTPKRFAANDSGAVTVDWVVLCAAVTALTLAMYDEVGSALGFFSDDVTEELTNSEIVRAGNENQVGFSFDGGALGRWSGAEVTDIPGFGNALGPIAGSGGRIAVSHDFIMASDIDVSIIQFDVYSLDSLDNESGIIFINGVEVGRVTTSHNGGVTFTSAGVDGITFGGVVVAEGEDIGGYQNTGENGPTYWLDDISTITIAVEDPGDVLSFGFGSDANQEITDEAYAIDNFNISGVDVEQTNSTGDDQVATN